MNLNYSVKEDDSKYAIYDDNTEALVHSRLTRSRANLLARRLNAGSGFGEFSTPGFFTYTYKRK
jgi:hypothetical protein